VPGVYRLSPGARLVHLVEAAGGMNNFADPAAVNLAAPLEDGMHVHIPKKGERTPEQPVILDIPLAPVVTPGQPRESRGNEPHEPRGSNSREGKPREGKSPGARTGNRAFSEAPIDVNRATEEELIALKGIGPVLAKSIVEYRRKNGPFKSIDDLILVRGIGAKKLEGFRDRAVARP
jgi:competence protein ComEA